MTCCKDYFVRVEFLLFTGLEVGNFYTFSSKIRRALGDKFSEKVIKVNLSAKFNNFLFHGVDDFWKLISSDVGMSIGQDIFCGTKFNKDAVNFVDIAALV